jgi:high affinity sulfate transporter 1
VTALIPPWLRSYDRGWLSADVVAGVVIWSVVTPQAVAYAQIAGLPPEAGLMAAPVAMAAYAFLGTSRQLVVSATTATSAVSAATVGVLAGGDVARFAALSAAFALVVGVVLALGGWLRFGAVADLVSKPVMTGFLFGLGLVIALAQVPSLLGVAPGEGNFFPALVDVLGEAGELHGLTLAVGAASVAVLVLGRRFVPALPTTLLVLVVAIAVSGLAGFADRGVDVVGEIPRALPDPAVPRLSADDFLALIAPALGVLVLSAEAVGVARGLAVKHGYRVDPNRDLMAMGAANVLCGLSSGFVQSGGASQTAAADGAGGRSQLASLVAAGLLLLTGAFLAPLFENLPQATLAAIVVVAVAGFFDVAELRRYVRVRRSAVVFSALALAGVLVLGVLQGLIVAAGLSLVYVVRRLSRPTVARLVRDPATGVWGHVDRHPDWQAAEGVVVIRCYSPLMYPNATAVKDHVLALAAAFPAHAVVLDLGATGDLDVQSADTVGELAGELGRQGVELRLARVRGPAREILERTGVADRVRVEPTLDAAVRDG